MRVILSDQHINTDLPMISIEIQMRKEIQAKSQTTLE